MRPLLLLRWSLRDLRRRWLQVVAVAVVISVGTGVHAALGSTAAWRRTSNDASFELLRMYDVRVRASAGADAPAGSLLSALRTLPDPGVVVGAEERLVLPTQVEVPSAGGTVRVPGRVVGVDVADGEPEVARVLVQEGDGRGLAPGGTSAVLERNFARYHDLPPAGDLRLSGGAAVPYVGLGMAPEQLLVISEEGGFFAQASFATVFLPLPAAQAVTGRDGRVNDLVLRVREGEDPAAVRAQVDGAVTAAGLGLGHTTQVAADEEAYRVLYDDIETDQRLWNVFALIILLGAAFAAFNLVSRMVEGQRREIGIGMALGAPARHLAVRPLLVGAQIALLGVVLGLAMGVLVMAALRPVFRSMLPLPVWQMALQPSTFARGAALGFVLPLVATAWPVWRAVRVMPVDAISTTHRTARGGLAPLLRRLRWPVSAFRRMPVGNVLRAPRRTLLTALGIGAAITTLVALLGMVDSFARTMDRNEREVLQAHDDRVAVSLDGFVPVDGPEVSAVAASPAVGEVAPVVRLGARMRGAAGAEVDVVLEALDLDGHVWAPTVVEGDGGDEGLVVARKAAEDLGVRVGDSVLLEHPALRDGRLDVVTTRVPVAAIHPGPFRFNAYLDRSALAPFGAAGMANALYVLPAEASTTGDVSAALFGTPGVASVQPVAVAAGLMSDMLDDMAAVFQALQVFVLVLALLIAYNATSINADERARERATLFAFGLPLRRVLGLEAAEGLLVGLLGTAAGVGAGLLVLRWMSTSLLATSMPDLDLDVALSALTLATAAVVGVVAVTVAPLLTVRRLRRMDIPGTLRVVE